MEHERDSYSQPSRKRDRSSVEDCNGYAALQEQDGQGASHKRRPRNAAAVGSYVIKTFPGEAPTSAPRFLLGKVTSYGCGLYTTVFDDGSREALHNHELRQMLLGQQDMVQGDPDEVFQSKKIKLEELISSEGSNAAAVAGSARTRSRKGSSVVTMPENASVSITENANTEKKLDSVDVPSPNITVSILDEDDEDDADSCTDSSCDSLPNIVLETFTSMPKFPLPPSSSDICVPEDAVPLLFSVYSFLRSFSHQLFLSPFGFDDFVGSLNCTSRNTLFDAVHVALMRALRRHFEAVASEGSKVASRSLKLVSWNLLDMLTWPVILTQYFFVMRHMKQINLKSFLAGTLVDEYHSLSVTCKLTVLQILCDDIVEALELRTELAMRESMDEEREDDFYPNTLYPENGPRRVHPRYSKTSACKDIESLDHAITAEQVNGIKVTGKDAGVLDAVQDGNSDECRLCGMDGTLICCDGCPSAYHSRCIGLNKASLPEGQWFCPECVIKRMGPTSSQVSLGIKGAEHFGVDPFGRIFLGVCNYLLVLEDFSATPISRYYNQNDVVKVFQLLCSVIEALPHYASICQAIASFWEISMKAMQDRPGASVTSPGNKKIMVSENSNQSVIPYSRENDPLGQVNFSEEDISFSKYNESSFVTVLKGPQLCEQEKTMQSFHTGVKYITHLNGLKNGQLAVEDFNLSMLHSPQLVNESSLSFDTPGLPTDNSSTNHPDPIQVIMLPHNELLSSKIIDESSREDATSLYSQTKTLSLCSPNDNLLDSSSNNGKINDKSHIVLHSGPFYKPQGYSNQYLHGEVAASAAAKLAALLEEAKVSQSHTSHNQRKNLSLDIALQAKAFSAVCLHFQWPSSEKKTADVPRERCGWCIACKGAATCKKGCLLNAAVSNAIKVSLRCLRTIKNDGRVISSIAAYILHMEENLHDLMDGSLADAKYNSQWRKSVKDASTCTVLKYHLLELEESIREIAFIGGWMKPVDEWAVELPGVVKGECAPGSSQRRGFGGRRNRKQSTISDINTSDGDDDLEQFIWWRGGECLREIFHFGELPRSLAKRIARQGGLRVVSGIFYSLNHKSPVRTRQLSWRAAVEVSKNSSVLAFQVRYLDAYLRWKELVRPEQTLLDGKTTDVEASAFRNAIIYDKKVVDSKIRYAVKFINQKHLPLRVKKNILEVDHCLDEREKLWFSECHVPLYLIKEYEGRENQAGLSADVSKVKSSSLLKFQIRQRKTIYKDIFSYLFNKKHAKHPCVSCRQDMLFRDSDTCNNCQGFCHKHCLAKGGMCNPCCSESDLRETHMGSLSASQDLVQSGEKTKTNNVVNPFILVNSEEAPLEANTTTSSFVTEKKKKNITYGLIWKRKRPNESGTAFHHNHLILRRGVGQEVSLEPICKLCSKPYNRDLMYIRCETCLNWYHAESVHLEEEQLPELVGFKCCKCRRVKIPRCPYENLDSKKPELRPGHKNLVRRSSMSPHLALPPSPVNDHTRDEDNVFPLERIDDTNLVAEGEHLQQTAPILASLAFSQKKLPVRRLANSGLQMDGSSAAADTVDSGCSALAEKGFFTIHEADCAKGIERSSFLDSEVDFRSANDRRETSAIDTKEEFLGSEGGGPDDMEYEPQTYFSFTELLSTGDGDVGDLYDGGDWCQLSAYGVEEDDAAQEDGFGLSESCDMGQTEEFVTSNDATLEGAECRRCKQCKPPPDLICGICGFIIHYLCSPWDEREAHESGKWRCGPCRDWR